MYIWITFSLILFPTLRTANAEFIAVGLQVIFLVPETSQLIRR